MPEIWIVVVALSVLVEVLTNAYAALFVGLAALVGFLGAPVGLSMLIQLILVLGLAAAGLVLVRPMALADLSRNRVPSRSRRAGADPYLDDAPAPRRDERVGIVETIVGDENHPGRVLLDGRLYHAVTDYPRDLPDGTSVLVRGSRHGTLWVEPY